MQTLSKQGFTFTFKQSPFTLNMSVFEDINTIKLLQNLLVPPGDDGSDSEDENLAGSNGIHKFGT